MRLNITYCILLLCTILLPVFEGNSQGTSSKKAEKLYDKGMTYYEYRDFENGEKHLRMAIDEDPNYFEAHYALGMNLRVLRNYEESNKHLRKAAQIVPNKATTYGDLYLTVGDLDFQAGKYSEAKEWYDKLFLAYKDNPKYSKTLASITLRKRSCEFAIEAIKNPLNVESEELSAPINQMGLQYFAVLSADQNYMIFVGRKSSKKSDDENLFESFRDEQGNWSEPTLIPGISTPYNDGICTISADGRVMIFSACAGNPERPVIGNTSCDLFVSVREGKVWSKPQNMGAGINTGRWESQPSLSADGRTLYFVSDRNGGYGGSDIWVVTLGEDQKWSAPRNLGKGINTSEDELAPFIHNNGRTLYFSSDGHVGMGNMDIYKSESDDDGNFLDVQNLGYPINNNKPQLGFFVAADNSFAYYNEERTQGSVILESKIRRMKVVEEIKPKIKSNFVNGHVYDAVTKKPLKARVELYNVFKEMKESSFVSDGLDGSFMFVVNTGNSYALNVNKEGYLFQSMSFDYTNEDTDQKKSMDIYLQPIEKGSVVTLRNIFFETNKWDLMPESTAELNIILKFMKDNSSMRIEVSGHTDDVGSDSDNASLSEKRAKSVKQYLEEHGIASDRIIAIGYGEKNPEVPNTSDENRARNRRIEFKIL